MHDRTKDVRRELYCCCCSSCGVCLEPFCHCRAVYHLWQVGGNEGDLELKITEQTRHQLDLCVLGRDDDD